MGKIDVVINNAGIVGNFDHPETPIKDSITNFEKIYKINLLGAFLVSKYAA